MGVAERPTKKAPAVTPPGLTKGHLRPEENVPYGKTIRVVGVVQEKGALSGGERGSGRPVEHYATCCSHEPSHSEHPESQTQASLANHS